MTTLQLVTVELYARELSRLDEIDQAIEKFLRRRPEVRRNPRAMETLLSYRRGTVASLIKLAPLIGMERQAKAPTITDLLHEEQPQEPADQGTETGNETEDPTT